MIWNANDQHPGFRILSDIVVHITSINYDFGDRHFRKHRAELKIFNTFAFPRFYNRKGYYRDVEE